MGAWADLLAFFPALLLAAAAQTVFSFVWEPTAGKFLSLAFLLYGAPLLAFRWASSRRPIESGVASADEEQAAGWRAAQRLQALYDACPALEALLRLVPGLFSFWLRLWGSRIGRDVEWPARLDVRDRSLLDVGDRVRFGHGVACAAHDLRPKNGREVLYVRKISIGDDVFIGAGTRIGPGVIVERGSVVPPHSDLAMNRRVTRDQPLRGAGE